MSLTVVPKFTFVDNPYRVIFKALFRQFPNMRKWEPYIHLASVKIDYSTLDATGYCGLKITLNQRPHRGLVIYDNRMKIYKDTETLMRWLGIKHETFTVDQVDEIKKVLWYAFDTLLVNVNHKPYLRIMPRHGYQRATNGRWIISKTRGERAGDGFGRIIDPFENHRAVQPALIALRTSE